MAHPYKADEILEWELQRRERIAATVGECEEETEEERAALESDYEIEQEEVLAELMEERHIEHLQKEERKKLEAEEPAWNLGKYHASGYCLEDVEREEGK